MIKQKVVGYEHIADAINEIGNDKILNISRVDGREPLTRPPQSYMYVDEVEE